MIAHQETTVIAGERLIYTVRRSRRAKHLLLQVDVEGQVEVVLPWRVAASHATSFVRDHHDWLQRHLTKRRQRSLPRRRYESEEQVPCLGQHLTLAIRREPQRRRASVVQRGELLHVILPARGLPKRALEVWYRRQARAYFTPAAHEAARALGVRVVKISIGNHATQWGSCSARGRLSFNWRLLLGPQWIADYVVAHEVAHLLHHNHSPRYWATVAKIYPQHAAARRWLREHAALLTW